MTYTLLHNPRCSKSRLGLALLEEKGIAPVVRLYMKDEEKLSVEELKTLARKLGASSPKEFWRKKEAKEAGLDETSTDEDIYVAMAEEPRIIERPIGIKGKKAAAGRPSENLLEIL